MRAVLPLLLSLLALACAAGAAAAQPADTSVGYMVNPAHTGEVPGSTLTPPLAVSWVRNDLRQTSYPIVAEGKVVVALPSTTPKIVALDARTGETVWSATLEQQTWRKSFLSYDDGRVFVADSENRVFALDMDTGARLWTAEVWERITAPPTAVDGIVYVESSGDLFALRATDGSQVFLARMVASGGYSSPTVDDDSVYLAYSCENVYRFDRLTGEQKWWHRSDCSGGGGETPVVAGDRVYVRHREWDQVQVHAKSTGAAIEKFTSRVLPAFAGASRLSLPDWVLTTGTWRFEGDGYLSGAPVIANGIAYVGSASGRVYGLDPTTGALVWQGFAGAKIPYTSDVSSEAWPGMGAGQGVLVVPTVKGVTAFAEEAAIPPWEPIEPAPTPVPASPGAAPVATPPAFAPFVAAPPAGLPGPSAARAARVVPVRTARSFARLGLRSARAFTRSSSPTR